MDTITSAPATSGGGFWDSFSKIAGNIVTTGGDYLAQKLQTDAQVKAATALYANPVSAYNRPVGDAPAPGMSQQTLFIGATVLGLAVIALAFVVTRK